MPANSEREQLQRQIAEWFYRGSGISFTPDVVKAEFQSGKLAELMKYIDDYILAIKAQTAAQVLDAVEEMAKRMPKPYAAVMVNGELQTSDYVAGYNQGLDQTIVAMRSQVRPIAAAVDWGGERAACTSFINGATL